MNTTGNGMLIEFASAYDAVQGAIGIQSSMTKREAEQREDQRIRYRVGINLGDVIHDDGDIFGDGVNVAAQSGTGRALLRQCFEVGRGGA